MNRLDDLAVRDFGGPGPSPGTDPSQPPAPPGPERHDPDERHDDDPPDLPTPGPGHPTPPGLPPRPRPGDPEGPPKHPHGLTKLLGSDGLDADAASHSIDGFADVVMLRALAGALAARASDFATEIVAARPAVRASLNGDAPRETEVRVLHDAFDVAEALDEPLRRRFAAVHVDVTARRLAVFAVESGATLRLDLGNEPPHADDVLFVTAFDSAGAAEATLRIARNDAAHVSVPLQAGRAVFVPAQRPVDLTGVTTAGSDFGDRLYVVAALLRVVPSGPR